ALSVRVGDFAAGRTAKVVARLTVPTSVRLDIEDVVKVSIDAVDARHDTRLTPPPAELAVALTSNPAEAAASDLLAADLGFGSSGDRFFETNAAGVIAYVPPPHLEGDELWRSLRSLRTITSSRSVLREGDKEEDGNLDYGMLTELPVHGLVD